MRILVIHPNFEIKNLRKQPWYISYGLARHLKKRGHDVGIVTDVKCRLEGFDILTVEPSKLRFRLNRLREYLEKSDTVLYFGNSLSGLYLQSLRLKVPLILHINSMHYTLRELVVLRGKEIRLHISHLLFSIPPLSYTVRLLNKRVVEAIVVPNYMTRDRLVRFGVNLEKVKVIPTPFDAKSILTGLEKREDTRGRLGLSDVFLITYLGSPWTVRGTDTLLKAARILRKMIHNLKILLLSRVDSPSEWNEEKYLASLIRSMGLSDIVQSIPGVLSKKEVRDYIWASDIIALPFKIVPSEPPLAILESMILRRPVVTTRTCGLPELISPDRGVLINPNESEELTLAISDLYRHPEKAGMMGGNAQDFVSGLPSWDEVTDLYESLLEELTGDSN